MVASILGIKAELAAGIVDPLATAESEIHAAAESRGAALARQVRSVGTPEDPWFVAADICKACGIKQTTKAVENLDADEKGVEIVHTLAGPQEMLCVNESGLYADRSRTAGVGSGNLSQRVHRCCKNRRRESSGDWGNGTKSGCLRLPHRLAGHSARGVTPVQAQPMKRLKYRGIWVLLSESPGV